jgi:hypothetical protein
MNAVTKIEHMPVANQPVTPMQMLQIAIEKGADMAQLEKLMDLNERWEAAQAKKAYQLAMQEFKKDPPHIVKNKQVAYSSTKFKHAELDQVSELIGAALAKVGISHHWSTKQDGSVITVTCTLTHVAGHSESVSLSSPPDTSGAKNSIQAIASAVTYLQRYTLQGVTGIAAEADDDGRGFSGDPISEKQLSTLTDMIVATETDEAKFLAYLGCESLASLPAKEFNRAMTALRSKVKK